MEWQLGIGDWMGRGFDLSRLVSMQGATVLQSDSSSDAAEWVVDHATPNWEVECVVQMELGRPDAFTPVVSFYTARIYTHLFRIVRNREEAEDLTQETFVLTYRKIGSYDRSRPFRNWIYAIATNVGRNALRSRGRRIPSARMEEVEKAPEKVSVHSVMPEAAELKEQLVSAVDRLPDPLPTLIQLHYQEGLTIREAAVILDMTESAAKVALHRARKTLRAMLRKDEL